MDSNILPTGYEIEELIETFVIFITENDVIGMNKLIYHIECYIKEVDKLQELNFI